jgi:hypothetical protein
MRPLTPAALAVTARADADVRFLLQIDFTVPAALTLRLSDQPITAMGHDWLPLVVDWGTVDAGLNVLDLGGKPTTVTLTLDNSRAIEGTTATRLTDLIYGPRNAAGYQWAFAKATVYALLDPSHGLSDAVTLGVFYLEDPQEASSEQVAITMSDLTQVIDGRLGLTKITRALLPQAPDHVLDRHISVPFGRVRVEAVPVVDSAESVLNGSLLAATTSGLTLADASRFPTSGTVQIGGEHIAYTGKSGDTLTGLTRAQASTTAADHDHGATVHEVRQGAQAYRYAVGQHLGTFEAGQLAGAFRIKSLANVWVNGVPPKVTPSIVLEDTGLIAGKRFAMIDFPHLAKFYDPEVAVTGTRTVAVTTITSTLNGGAGSPVSPQTRTVAPSSGGGTLQTTRTLTARLVRGGNLTGFVNSYKVKRRLSGGSDVIIAQGSFTNGQGGTVPISDVKVYDSTANEIITLEYVINNCNDGSLSLIFDQYKVEDHGVVNNGGGPTDIGPVTVEVEGIQDDSAGTITGVVSPEGPELITNGDFATNLTGWTEIETGSATISHSASGGGRASCVNTTGGPNTAAGRQVVTVVAGTPYTVRWEIVDNVSTGGYVRIGSTAGGSDLLNLSLGAGSNALEGPMSAIIESPTTDLSIEIGFTAPLIQALTFDNVSIKKLPTQGPVLENPVDIVRIIHQELYDIAAADLGATWPIARQALAGLGYVWAFALDFTTYAELRRVIGEQSRCALYMSGGKVEFRFMAEQPAPDRTLVYNDDVDRDRPAVVRRTLRDQVVNSLTVSSQLDPVTGLFKRTKPHEDLTQPGLTEPIPGTLQLPWVQDAATADDLGNYWLNAWKRQRWDIDVVAWHNVMALELGDHLTIDGHPLLGVQGELVYRLLARKDQRTGVIEFTAIEVGFAPSSFTPTEVLMAYGSRGNTSERHASNATQWILKAALVFLRDATITSIVVRDNPSNVTVDIATAGPVANGRDQSGAFSNDSWVHFYWIWNGTTLAGIASAAAPPTGPTLPSGYTHWCYEGSARVDGSGNIVKMYHRGNRATYEAARSALAAGTATSETAVSLAALAPPNALEIILDCDAGDHPRLRPDGHHARDDRP